MFLGGALGVKEVESTFVVVKNDQKKYAKVAESVFVAIFSYLCSFLINGCNVRTILGL